MDEDFETAMESIEIPAAFIEAQTPVVCDLENPEYCESCQ